MKGKKKFTNVSMLSKLKPNLNSYFDSYLQNKEEKTSKKNIIPVTITNRMVDSHYQEKNLKKKPELIIKSDQPREKRSITANSSRRNKSNEPINKR